MLSDSKDRTVAFLQYAIDQLEARISLVDSKASILIAVVVGVSAGLTFIVEKLLWNVDANPQLRSASYVVLPLLMAWLLSVILLLLRTVRPTKYLLGSRARLEQHSSGFFSVLWPRDNFMMRPLSQDEDKKDYADAIERLPDTRQAHCEEAHFALMQLLRRKYRYYELATCLLKWWVFVMFILCAVWFLGWLFPVAGHVLTWFWALFTAAMALEI